MADMFPIPRGHMGVVNLGKGRHHSHSQKRHKPSGKFVKGKAKNLMASPGVQPIDSGANPSNLMPGGMTQTDMDGTPQDEELDPSAESEVNNFNSAIATRGKRFRGR